MRSVRSSFLLVGKTHTNIIGKLIQREKLQHNLMCTCASYPHHQSLNFSFCAFSPFFAPFPLFSPSCPSSASFSSPSQDFDATLGGKNQNVTNCTQSFFYTSTALAGPEPLTIFWISFIFTGLVRTPLFLSSSRLLEKSTQFSYTIRNPSRYLTSIVKLTGSQRADPL